MICEWLVKDVIERIEKDNKNVGLYLNWANWYVLVSVADAINVLKRFPPDQRISINITCGDLFVG